MDREAALKLARECGAYAEFRNGPMVFERQDQILAFAAAIRAEALREAAALCRDEYVEAEVTNVPEDRAYNMACDHCAEAIESKITKE